MRRFSCVAIETGVGGVNVTDGRYVDHQRKSSRDARRFAEEQAVVVEVECRGTRPLGCSSIC